ncbi:uncharacterized protein TNIN_153271 [Trichonephila inaurata madagascariensis]|uniref:Uncharacterized protein n=1 Tax=Trichonephila inaurata madagascariensis TaxID=2747483 RepID=A0A8X6XWB3_9ARAC|nr:uncharacterized protein TNIN_153271 [Trichonephila inaurata madagascariensis]
MGTDRHENHTLSLGFSRAGGGAPDTAAATVLFRRQRPFLLATRFEGHAVLRRKVNSSPGPPTTSPSSVALPHYRPGGRDLRVRDLRTDSLMFNCCSHETLLRASVFQALTGIFATTTKICTAGGSSPTHAATFYAHRRDPPTR